MQHRFTLSALLACTLAAALPASAQDIKPGLWEVNNKVSSSSPQAQAAISEVQRHLASMSPEQRQSMQQMLERNGVQLDIGAGGALQSRMCMTREMIERREFPVQQGNCTQNVTPIADKRLKVAFSCTKPRASGEGEMTVESPTSYRARMRIRSDERNETVDMDVNGRWVGADCGSVRPVAVPKGK